MSWSYRLTTNKLRSDDSHPLPPATALNKQHEVNQQLQADCRSNPKSIIPTEQSRNPRAISHLERPISRPLDPTPRSSPNSPRRRRWATAPGDCNRTARSSSSRACSRICRPSGRSSSDRHPAGHPAAGLSDWGRSPPRPCCGARSPACPCTRPSRSRPRPCPRTPVGVTKMLVR